MIKSLQSPFCYIPLALLIPILFAGCSKSGTSPQPTKNNPAVVTTLAGDGTYGHSNGLGTAASFSYPDALAIDATGNIYVGDGGDNLVRKISPDGNVSTITGGVLAAGAGVGGIAIDPTGNVYLTFNLSQVIMKITPDGKQSIFAGSGQIGFANGVGSAALFSSPLGLKCDKSGNLYVADYANYMVRKITPDATVSTVPGTGLIKSPGSELTNFLGIQGLTLDGSGNIYTADPVMDRVARINTDGTVTPLAFFHYPTDVAIDASGNIYATDQGSHVIKKITPDGKVSIIAGSGSRGYKDGTGTDASFNLPQAIVIDPTGTILYVADAGNSVIRKVVFK